MEAVFLAIISQLNSAVFVLLAILLMAFWAAYKVGSLVTFFKETKSESKRTDLKIDDMRGTLSRTTSATTTSSLPSNSLQCESGSELMSR